MPNLSRIVPGVNQDNTGRTITYDYQTPVFAATIAPMLVASRTTVLIPLTGATTFNPSVAQSYIGDELTVLFGNATAGILVVTTGVNISSIGTLSVSAGKKGSATFVFDGASWVETGRAVTV